MVERRITVKVPELIDTITNRAADDFQRDKIRDIINKVEDYGFPTMTYHAVEQWVSRRRMPHQRLMQLLWIAYSENKSFDIGNYLVDEADLPPKNLP